MLTLVWEMAATLLVAEFILSIVYPAGEAGLYRYPGSNFTYEFASTLVRGGVFVWFAWRAMKFSFGHGLLLAALSVTLGYPNLGYQAQSLHGFGLLLFATGLTLALAAGMFRAVALIRFDSASVGRRVKVACRAFGVDHRRVATRAVGY